ncbi:hypothetical protein A2U01_0002201 [Trifolium medium]|uniref:Uncharacterized protein n=1 Tax=Trifolium medium TaxID=97028 RepID=A0A392M4V4_9FABA|nr:hypothetical protein [Trifolium medium]
MRKFHAMKDGVCNKGVRHLCMLSCARRRGIPARGAIQEMICIELSCWLHATQQILRAAQQICPT